MTCVAAISDGLTVWMGADSAGADERWDLVVRLDPKVFKRGEWLIGFTTSFRMGQLLLTRFKPPRLARRRDLLDFMCTDFVDAVRQCLKDGGYARKESEQESAGTFLVGFRGRLFAIHDDYQVEEAADGFNAVGCGHAYAKGALHALQPLSASLSPAQKLHVALEAAERFSAGVRGPYRILSTGDALAGTA